MKHTNILSILLSTIFIASCSAYKMPTIVVNGSHDPSDVEHGDYIKFENGRTKILDTFSRRDREQNPELQRHSEDMYGTYLADLSNGDTRRLKLDDEKHKTKDIKAVQLNNTYYLKGGKNTFYKRLYNGTSEVYTAIQYSTTYSPQGGSTTTKTTLYGIRAVNLNKGELIGLHGQGKQDYLRPYLKSSTKAIKILDDYEETRKRKRRDKFIALGLWGATGLLGAVLPKNSDGTSSGLKNTANLTFAAGFFVVPFYALLHGRKNRRKIYESVQTFIDQDIYKYQSTYEKPDAVAKQNEDMSPNENENVANGAAEIPASKSIAQIGAGPDYIRMMNNTVIEDSTNQGLLIGNNTELRLNGRTYKKGIKEYKKGNDLYLRVPSKDKDLKDKYMRRIVDGDIDLFASKYTKSGWINKRAVDESNTHVADIHSYNSFYFRDDSTNYTSNKYKSLKRFARKNPQTYKLYNGYVDEIEGYNRKSKISLIAGWGLFGAGIANYLLVNNKIDKDFENGDIDQDLRDQKVSSNATLSSLISLFGTAGIIYSYKYKSKAASTEKRAMLNVVKSYNDYVMSALN